MSEDSFEFIMPGLTDREEDVLTAFVDRMHEIARDEGHPLDIWMDGGPILTRFVKEMLPDYTLHQSAEFMMKVLEHLSSLLALSKKPPEGSA